MKTILTAIILLCLNLNSFSQCLDFFGRRVDCPTENDSLVVYNNSLKVYEFYEKNRDYVKIKSIRLRTKQDVLNIFYSLQDAVDSFNTRWQLRERVINGENIPSVLLPRDGKNIPVNEYYVYIDEYRFFQRELENGILNTSSPFPIYDVRIAPLIVNSYENRFSNDGFNGDFVNIALYIPVTIKPYRLLTEAEKKEREAIMSNSISPNNVKPKSIAKKVVPIKEIKRVTNDTTLLSTADVVFIPPIVVKVISGFTVPPPNGIPVYYRNSLGSGCLIGYMVGRKFRKFLPTDEYYWALPNEVKLLLQNNDKLEYIVHTIYGDYFDGFYREY